MRVNGDDESSGEVPKNRHLAFVNQQFELVSIVLTWVVGAGCCAKKQQHTNGIIPIITNTY